MLTNLSLDATALSFDLPKLRRKHPNRLPFRGVLTVLDVPSDRAPTGSNNRRVLIPRAVAEAALPSLIGMALDYTPTLDGHDSRRKIGIIAGAEIHDADVAPGVSPGALGDGRDARPYTPGSQLTVRGYIFARDFPDVVLELLRSTAPGNVATSPTPPPIASHPSPSANQLSRVAAIACSPPLQRWEKGRGSASPVGATAITNTISAAAQNTASVIRAHVTLPFDLGQRQTANGQRLHLGMSYEIAEAQIVNEASPIWVLKDFVFTGAAVLRRDRAAYRNTSIELLAD